MRHNIARNATDGGYTKKFVARNVAEVGRNSTTAILRATILGVDTRCNLAISRNIARNIAPCIRTFKVAEHSFQGPMPNSPLLLNHLCFGVFLQESRLTTKVFILAMATGLPLKTRVKRWFLFI